MARCILFIALAFISSPVWAIAPGCFKFDKTLIQKPIKTPLALKNPGINEAMGIKKSGVAWGEARAKVKLPIEKALNWLLDHTNWKDMSKTKLEVTQQTIPGYFQVHMVDVEVNVFAFVTVSWTEQWAYVVLKGDAKAPQSVLVSYQKVKGTQHLENLCGSILLNKVDDAHTDIYFYEQSKASHHSKEDIQGMHRSNFEILKALGEPTQNVLGLPDLD